MNAWCIDHLVRTEKPELLSLKRKMDGPYMAAIETKFKLGQSEFSIVYELRSGDPNLYLHIEGVWFERGTPQTGVPSLNLVIPVCLDNPKASYEIPFGEIERATEYGEEIPALRWGKISGNIGKNTYGAILFNDSKHGYSFKDGKLKLSLIRSSYEPDILPEIAKHEIHAAVRVFSGEISCSDTIRAGFTFNHELKVVGTDIHKGSFPDKGCFIEPSNGNAVLSGMKKAEKTNGIVMRLFNPERKVSDVKLKFNSDIFGKILDSKIPGFYTQLGFLYFGVQNINIALKRY